MFCIQMYIAESINSFSIYWIICVGSVVVDDSLSVLAWHPLLRLVVHLLHQLLTISLAFRRPRSLCVHK